MPPTSIKPYFHPQIIHSLSQFHLITSNHPVDHHPHERRTMAHLHDISTWCIRGYGQHFDPYEEYVGEPTMFSIHIFHGGEFVVKPVLKYVKGKSNHIDYIDADEFHGGEFVVKPVLKYVKGPVIAIEDRSHRRPHTCFMVFFNRCCLETYSMKFLLG
ncbi:hypothetical protein Hdeb2414_s0135g00808381 [Helianthus debilis subsp. tardiflorus]